MSQMRADEKGRSVQGPTSKEDGTSSKRCIYSLKICSKESNSHFSSFEMVLHDVSGVKRRLSEESGAWERDIVQSMHRADPLLDPVQEDTQNSSETSISETDDPSLLTWTVDDFAKVSEDPIHGPTFTAGGFSWRLVLFPRGLEDSTSHISVFLQMTRRLPETKSCGVLCKFQVTLINKVFEMQSFSMDSKHIFNRPMEDNGFPRFFPLSELVDESEGYRVNDAITLKVDLNFPSGSLTPDSLCSDYDSKDATGFVGILNQGATCYMNSILQTMFHLPVLCKLVFSLPVPEEDSTSVSFALQSVFYELLVSRDCASTKELTVSFGWNDVDAFLQHDVQEFCRVLLDNLEEKLKKTPLENKISEIFEGKFRAFIECTQVDCTSAKDDSFYDLSLNVKGCNNVIESFQQYTEEELLEGDNQYRADSFGLQDAKKYIKFLSLPPVLQLQLKRFEYDPKSNMMVKLNNFYEFPETLDLTSFVDQQDPQEYVYRLHSVLVHAGSVYGGHYYAFVRPEDGSDVWYKFDDESVRKVPKEEAVDGNFGEDEQNGRGRRGGNAYMLVYVLMRKKELVFSPMEESDIPQVLREKIEVKRQQRLEEERLSIEEEKQTLLRFWCESSFEQSKGIELIPPQSVVSLKVYKRDSFPSILDWTLQQFDITSNRIEFYGYTKRENNTMRLNRIYNHKTFEDVSRHPDIVVRAKPDNESDFDLDDSLLLMLKYFDAEDESLSYEGSGVFSKSQSIDSVVQWFRAMKGIPVHCELLVWEEENAGDDRVNPILDFDRSVTDYRLICGDILCFQLKSSSHVTVPEYFLALKNEIVIVLSPVDPELDFEALRNERRVLHIDCSRDDGLEEVSRLVSEKIGVDPLCILLYGVDHRGAVLRDPWEGSLSLEHEFGFVYPSSCIYMFFDVLDGSEDDLMHKQPLRVFWASDRPEAVCRSVQLLVDPEGSSNDILTALRHSKRVSVDSTRPLRLVLVKEGKPRPVSVTATVKDLKKAMDTAYLRIEYEDYPICVGTSEPVFEVWIVFITQMKYLRTVGCPFMVRVGSDGTFGDLRRYLEQRLSSIELSGCKITVVDSYNGIEQMKDNVQFSQVEWGRLKMIGICQGKQTSGVDSSGSIRIYN